MIKLSGLLFLVLVISAVGQIDTERVAPALDNAELYRRAASSRLVVIGTISKINAVNKRLTTEILEKAKIDANAATGGALYTIQAEDIVCREDSFDPDARSVAEGSQKLLMFIPFDEPSFVNGNFQESVFSGAQYLLFLAELDPKEKEEWTKVYQLDTDKAYYRAEEHNRGVVPLVKPTDKDPFPRQPEILNRVRQLCEAMRPPNPKDKLVSLKKLAASGDPVLEKESAIAIEAVQKMMSVPSEHEAQPMKPR